MLSRVLDYIPDGKADTENLGGTKNRGLGKEYYAAEYGE